MACPLPPRVRQPWFRLTSAGSIVTGPAYPRIANVCTNSLSHTPMLGSTTSCLCGSVRGTRASGSWQVTPSSSLRTQRCEESTRAEIANTATQDARRWDSPEAPGCGRPVLLSHPEVLRDAQVPLAGGDFLRRRSPLEQEATVRVKQQAVHGSMTYAFAMALRAWRGTVASTISRPARAAASGQRPRRYLAPELLPYDAVLLVHHVEQFALRVRHARAPAAAHAGVGPNSDPSSRPGGSPVCLTTLDDRPRRFSPNARDTRSDGQTPKILKGRARPAPVIDALA